MGEAICVRGTVSVADEQIVALLRAGDGEGLRAAYERYKHDVVAVAAAVLGRCAADDAWDVLHDAFVGLARNGSSLREGTNLRAYLVRAAVNRARDRLRAAKSDAGELSTVPDGRADVLESLERDEEVAELLRGVRELPEEQRVVVSLRVWGELTFAQIAEIENISENTAQSRYRYALEKLRRRMVPARQELRP